MLAAAMVLGAFTIAQAADVTEADHQKAMKDTLAGMMGAGKAARATPPDMAAIATGAKAVEAGLAAVEPFWTKRKSQVAMDANAAGRKAAMALAAAKDEAGVKEAMGALQGSCKSCHDAHRVKNEDGTYSIK